MSDLTIVEGGKKGKGKGQKDEKPGLNKSQRKVIKINEVANIVAAGGTGVNLRVAEDDIGVRRILLVNDNKEVRYVDDDLLIYNLITYVQKFIHNNEDYIWMPNDAVACCRIFKAKHAIPEPKKFAWLSDPELCFKRLSFDFESKETYYHPTWSKVLDSIISGKDQFIHFIGSIFEPKSANQNYMWLHGHGRNSKGSVLRFLGDLMGSAATRLDAPNEHTQRFWTNALIGKRLGYMPDVSDFGFIKTGFWKSLTGGDKIGVEKKRGDFFNMKSECKFIVDSNDLPSISSKLADTRRIVLVEMGAMEEIEDFEEKLAQEGQEFINFCCSIYQKNYAPFYKAILCSNQDSVINLAEDNEEYFEYVFNQNFEFNDNAMLPARDLAAVAVNSFPGSARKQADFKSWFKIKIKQNKSVTLKYEFIDTKCYLKIRLKKC